MSEPERPAPIDPAEDMWPDQDDPEATRVVPRDRTHRADETAPPLQAAMPTETASPDAGAFASPPAPASGGDVPAAAPAWPSPAGGATGWPAADGGTQAWPSPAPEPQLTPQAGNFSGPGPAVDPAPTVVVPPYAGPVGEPDAASYLGAPTVAYPGTPAPGPQPYQQGGYSYPPQPGPQVIPAPVTTNVVLPSVHLPVAESRMALNLLGSVIGLLLVGGGLTLMLSFWTKIRPAGSGASDPLNPVAPDILPTVFTVVGVLLIALAAFLAAWASWAAILPGAVLTGLSVWAMVTSGPNSGSAFIDRATNWAVGDWMAWICTYGFGLAIGLLLLLTGLAAVFLRAGVRRTIRRQLDSVQG